MRVGEIVGDVVVVKWRKEKGEGADDRGKKREGRLGNVKRRKRGKVNRRKKRKG